MDLSVFRTYRTLTMTLQEPNLIIPVSDTSVGISVCATILIKIWGLSNVTQEGI